MSSGPRGEHPDTARLRDLTRRLGLGDGITDPQADNDTIVAYVNELARDAAEWREHESWRTDCYLAGHPDDDDCYEHDPHLAAQPPATDRDAALRALVSDWQATGNSRALGERAAAAWHEAARQLLDALGASQAPHTTT